MQGVQGIQDDGRRPRAGEGGGDLVPDVSGFPHAEDHHFAARFDAILDERRPREEKFSSSRSRKRWSSKISTSRTRLAFSR